MDILLCRQNNNNETYKRKTTKETPRGNVDNVLDSRFLSVFPLNVHRIFPERENVIRRFVGNMRWYSGSLPLVVWRQASSCCIMNAIKNELSNSFHQSYSSFANISNTLTMVRQSVGHVRVISLYSSEFYFRNHKSRNSKVGIQLNSVQFTGEFDWIGQSQNLMCFRIFELSLFKIHLIASSGMCGCDWTKIGSSIKFGRRTNQVSVTITNNRIAWKRATKGFDFDVLLWAAITANAIHFYSIFVYMCAGADRIEISASMPGSSFMFDKGVFFPAHSIFSRISLHYQTRPKWCDCVSRQFSVFIPFLSFCSSSFFFFDSFNSIFVCVRVEVINNEITEARKKK